MSLEVYDPTAEAEAVDTSDGTAQDWPKPQALPSALPPVAPFDVEALPDALRPFVEDTAARLQCPIEFCAAAAITAAGGLIGRAVGLAPKTSDPWREFPNLWACAVGQPSAMKSPALSEMLAPLHALEAEEREAWQPRLEQYERDLARWEIETKAAKQTMHSEAVKAHKAGEQAELGELPEEPEKPICPRIVVSDATIEAVVRIAAGNPRGLLMVRDELAGWLATFKKAGREADRAFYLEAASGKNSITVDRKGDGSLFADPLALAVVGSIQPGPLHKLVADASESTEGNDGLLQRFGLLVWPDLPECEFRVNDAKPDREARLLYVKTMKHLRTIETEWTEEAGLLRFTPEARKLWQGWYEAEMNELRAGDVPDALHAHRVKLAGKTCLGLALICECCDTPEPRAVGLTACKRAIRFTEILKTHAARLYAPQVSPDVEVCRLLVKKIQAGKLGDKFTCRDVYRHGWTGLKQPETIFRVCRRLCDMGWLFAKETAGEGRPSESYAVNPQLWKC